MFSRKFTVILHLLLVTMFLINCVTSAATTNTTARETQSNDGSLMTTESSNRFVATTPKITAKSSQESTEDELDDDDDDNGADEMATQHKTLQSRQSSDGFNPFMLIFNTVSDVLIKSAASAAQRTSAQLIGSDHNEELSEDNEGVDDNDNVTDTTTEKGVVEGRQAGAYIKGDPLNGYYDFVITEGSYKFWVVFQLATAALLIYSTLAAIYYSKVNPLTSDYDYVDYLSRSFKGRSMDSTDVIDDDDDNDERTIESGRTYLSSIANNPWVKAASYGFQFAMDAIDKVPK